MNILFLHPEGNFLYNPSLLAITEILAQRGFRVFITSFETPKENIASHVTILSADLRTLAKMRQAAIFLASIRSPRALNRFIFWTVLGCKPSLVLGVDSTGLIMASAMSKALGIPYAFISYELFFADEIDISHKNEEILAGKKLSFAICQGGIRSKLLSLENHIPPELIETIPVAPRGARRIRERISLQSYFNISQPKVAVVSGSVTAWTCIEEILLTTCDWPVDWALLVHSRYGIDAKNMQRLQKLSHSNVYFSSTEFQDINKLYAVLGNADIALAFYRPIYTNPWDGENLRHLGLSSGKISCFLREGVPVITNKIGEYSDLLESWKAGVVVSSPGELPRTLKRLSVETLMSLRQGSKMLYENLIDADLYTENIVTRFTTTLSRNSSSSRKGGT